MLKRREVPVDTLNALLRYEPDTGRFYWRERHRSFFSTDREFARWNRRYAGKAAFPTMIRGYARGPIFKTVFLAHRVAWTMHYGVEPDGFIDHINGNRSDNRICNLRVVTKSENSRNAKRTSANTSGVTGVSPFKGKWRASIRGDGGRQIHLGLFQTIDDAAAARREAEQALGYHPNHGRVGARHGVRWSEPVEVAA